MAQLTKSAIRETRDQLFLDWAVGQYLTNVSSNLGITRPLLGFSNDALWRALVRRLAADYRQVANLFRDWLTEFLGPQVTAATVLAQNVFAYDEQVFVTDPTRIPQQGTLIINEGLPTEQTIKYGYRNPRTGLVYLSSPIQNNNLVAVTDNVIGYLSADVSAGTTTLNLVDPTEFPVSGFDYTLLIGAGTEVEEAVSLTAHATITDPLTVSALANDHSGPVPSFVVAELQNVQGGGVVLTLDDSENFPTTGLVRIQDPGGTPSEIFEYTTHDWENNQLILKYALQNTYTLGSGGASVTLMRNGASVQLAQVQVKSVEWDLFQTEPNKIQIYIPENLIANRLQDASFVHDTVPTPPTATLAAAASIGDKQVELDDASLFPSGGVVTLSGSELIAYNRIDRFQTTLLIGGAAGLTTLYVQNSAVLKALALWSSSRDLVIDRGLGTEETVAWTEIDEAANTVTLASATVNAHVLDAVVETGNPNVLYLGRALTANHLAGGSADLTVDKYGGSDLEIGDPTVAPVNSFRYQGPYTYSFVDRLPKASTNTILSENLSGPIELQVDQIAGAASLEVRNADLFEPFGKFAVRVGRGRGTNESVDTTGVTLQRNVNALGLSLSAPASAGEAVLVLQVGEGGQLPNPSGGIYSYRLLVDRGGANEEVVVVNSISTDTLNLGFAMSKSHLAAESVELMADIISLAGTLKYAQQGKITLTDRLLTSGWSYRDPSRRAYAEEVRTSIQVASVSGYSEDGGTILVNFANQRVQTTAELIATAAAGTLTLSLDSSDEFPTVTPFYVEIDPDTAHSEVRQITTNDTVGDVLTLSGAIGLDYDHPPGTVVRFSQGAELEYNYTEIDTGSNEILFENGILVPHHLMSGLAVSLSQVSSNSQGDGLDYPFYLPLSYSERLDLIVAKGRAAGVEVEIISTK